METKNWHGNQKNLKTVSKTERKKDSLSKNGQFKLASFRIILKPFC